MKKKILKKIEIPQGIEAEVGKGIIKIKKGNTEMERKFFSFNMKKEGNALILSCEKATKKEKKLLNTTAAHIKNIISGLDKNYIYKLKICAVHFPMSVKVEKNELVVKNFLGEVKDRKAKILPGVEVKVEKDEVKVESHDKEKAGQTAANIEKATRIKRKDRRVFQDGIFITEKAKGANRRNEEK